MKTMKKVLAFSLALAMLIGMIPNVLPTKANAVEVMNIIGDIKGKRIASKSAKALHASEHKAKLQHPM